MAYEGDTGPGDGRAGGHTLLAQPITDPLCPGHCPARWVSPDLPCDDLSVTHDLSGTGGSGLCSASERSWVRRFVVLGLPGVGQARGFSIPVSPE